MSLCGYRLVVGKGLYHVPNSPLRGRATAVQGAQVTYLGSQARWFVQSLVPLHREGRHTQLQLLGKAACLVCLAVSPDRKF